MEAVIFTGIQATGKSSFYLERFYSTHIRLNMDMLKTRHREKLLLDACLCAKQNFVIDNTNPLRSDRKKYIDQIRQHDFEITGYYFQSNLNDCLARNKERIGKSQVPDIAILGTHKKMELPGFAEGYDHLYYVSLQNGKFIVEEYRHEI
ncbi:MAG: AAA family ATPase [Lachnospiraceae bacterium]